MGPEKLLFPSIILLSLLLLVHQLAPLVACIPIHGDDEEDRVAVTRSPPSASSPSVVAGDHSAAKNVVIDGTLLACPDSYLQYYCLNRGKCFLVNTGISYEYNCEYVNNSLPSSLLFLSSYF